MNQANERETRDCIKMKYSWVDRETSVRTAAIQSAAESTDETEPTGFAWRASLKEHCILQHK